MRIRTTISALFLCFVACWAQEVKNVSVKRNIKLMGTTFEITVVAQNEEIGYINIEEAASEIKRIEQLISSWLPDSETNKINKNAGICPVAVSVELYNLIERSVQLSELTNGAFDITYASLEALWNFDGEAISPPTRKEIAASLASTGYKQIELDPVEHTVFLKKKGAKINFGGIGKGYAADKAKALLVSKQVPAGMINAAGDITTWGTKATGEKWLIGVANPIGNGNLVSWVPLLEASVAVSGNHRKYLSLNGINYTDILDPRTGYPSSGISKVTVFSKMAEFCDALATAIFVMGADKGLAMINQLGGAEAIIEDEDGSMVHSKGLLLEMQ